MSPSLSGYPLLVFKYLRYFFNRNAKIYALHVCLSRAHNNLFRTPHPLGTTFTLGEKPKQTGNICELSKIIISHVVHTTDLYGCYTLILFVLK